MIRTILLILLLFFLGWALGAATAKAALVKDCNETGWFVSHGSLYDCEIRATP